MLREIELILSEDKTEPVKKILSEFDIIDKVKLSIQDNMVLWKIIVTAEVSSGIMDVLEKKLSFSANFRLNLRQIEAYLPLNEEENDKKSKEDKLKEKTLEEAKKTTSALSRMELYTDIKTASTLSHPYLMLSFLSAVVAAAGLIQNNVAVIIGAMVIAPLLGPNMGMALAATLGDYKLAKEAIITNFTGIFLSLIVSVIIGWIVPISSWSSEIISRTSVGWGDIALALAAGAAGSLAFSTGISGAVIGVMIAVALVPPLIAGGLLLGAGEYTLAVGAILLFACNIISINLSAIITFTIQGLKPLNWWEKPKAERSLRISYIIWITMLIILIYIIYIS